MALDIETIGIGFDTGPLERGKQALQNVGGEAGRTSDAMDALKAEIGRMNTQLGTNTTALGNLDAKHREAQGGAKEHESAIERLAKEMQTTQVRTNDLLKAIKEQGDEAKESAAKLDKLRDSVGDMGDKAQKAKGHSSDLSEALGMFAKLGASVYLIEQFAENFLAFRKVMLDTQIAADKLDTLLQFSSTKGSVEEIKYLKQVTDELGMEFSTTAIAYGKFTAATKDSALEGEAARKVFEGVAKAATVLGLSADETQGVLLAMNQMISKGTVQSEELKGQLGERLPGAFQIAARAMGVTTEELGKMLERGEVIADDFLPRFARELEETFGDAVVEAAGKTQGAVNRMENAWSDFLRTVADSGVSRFFVDSTDDMTVAMKLATQGMKDAKDAGGGFFAQMYEGSKAIYNHMSVFNDFTGSVTETEAALKKADKEMLVLQQRLAAQPDNIYIKQSIVDLGGFIKKLQETRAAQDLLTGAVKESSLATQLRSKDNETLVAAEGLAAKAAQDRTKLEKELGSQLTTLSGINKDYIPQIMLAKKGYEEGVLTAEQYADRVGKISEKSIKETDTQKAANTARKEASAEAKRAADEHDRLIKSYADVAEKSLRKSEQDLVEKEGQVKLTETQKDYIKVFADVRDNKVKYTDLVKAGVIEDLAAALANDQVAQKLKATAEETKKAEKATADQVKQNEAFTLQTEKKNKSLDDEIDKQKAANEVLAGNKDALKENSAEKYLALAAASERAAMVALERGEDQLQYETLKRQAEKYQELAGLKENAIYLTEAKKAREEWDKTTEAIGKGLTDSLFRAFESGKDFFTVLWDGVKNTFKTTILKPIIEDTLKPFNELFKGIAKSINETVLSPIMKNVVEPFLDIFKGAAKSIGETVLKPGLSTDGMGSFFETLKGGFSTLLSNVAGGFSSLLSSAGGLFRSLFGGGGSAGGLGGASGGGGLTSLLSTGSSIMSGLSSAGSTVMGWLGMGSGAAASTASYSAMVAASEAGAYGVGAAAAGAGGAGIMSSIAAAAPWIAAGVLVISLLSKKGGGPKVSGAFNDAGFAGIPGGGELDTGVAGIFGGVKDVYGGLATTLGGTAGNLTGAAFLAKDPKGTANTQFVLDAKLNGQEIYSRNNRTTGGNVEDVGRSEDAIGSAVDLASIQAVLKALQATDFADDIDAKLDAISSGGSAASIKAAIATVVEYKAQQDAAAAPPAATTSISDPNAGYLASSVNVSSEVMGTYTRIAVATETAALRLSNLQTWLYESADGNANKVRQALYDIDQNEALSRDLIVEHLGEIHKMATASSQGEITVQTSLMELVQDGRKASNDVVTAIRNLEVEMSRVRAEVVQLRSDSLNEGNSNREQIDRTGKNIELAVGLSADRNGRLVADTVREVSK